MSFSVPIKRVYDRPQSSDGTRILVDRLWPRGLTKDKAAVDIWLKNIAPSPQLRTWFAHDSEKWHEFAHRYTAELQKNTQAVEALRALFRKGPATLVYAARDGMINHAVVLQRFLTNN